MLVQFLILDFNNKKESLTKNYWNIKNLASFFM